MGQNKTDLVQKKEAVKWERLEGIIYFPPFVSDGRTAKEWFGLNKNIGDLTKDYLFSKNFKPTNGKIYRIVVVKAPDSEDMDKFAVDFFVIADKFELVEFEASLLMMEKINKQEVRKMGYHSIKIQLNRLQDDEGDRHLLKTHNIGRVGCGHKINRIGWALGVPQR